MGAERFDERVRTLIDAWCERRELSALAQILPAWLGNNGLTDGWTDLRDALNHCGTLRDLPDAERDAVKALWVELDYALRNR